MSESSTHGLAAAARRIRLIAGQTLGEALRMRLAGLFAAVATLVLLGSRWLQDFNFGATELVFLGDLGLGVTGLSGTLLAALATAQLFFNDASSGATACILTRPVRRWEYILGKLVGTAGLLALFIAGLGGLLGALMVWRSHQLGAPALALSVFLGACALQWMKFTLVAAMTLAVCAYARSALFAACAGLMLAAIGHLRPFATGPMEWLRIWPNLTVFDSEGLFTGSPLSGSQLAGVAAYWGAFLLLFVWLAYHAFKRREF